MCRNLNHRLRSCEVLVCTEAHLSKGSKQDFSKGGGGGGGAPWGIPPCYIYESGIRIWGEFPECPPL